VFARTLFYPQVWLFEPVSLRLRWDRPHVSADGPSPWSWMLSSGEVRGALTEVAKTGSP
jgi:hypothetical protein